MRRGAAIAIIGAGGHGKVAAEAWRSTGGGVLAFFDDEKAGGDPVLSIPIAGTVDDALAGRDALHLAIGSNAARQRLATGAQGDRFVTIIHAAAAMSASATCGDGTLICAGAIVQSEARLGRHVIVNSGAIIEHDAEIGDFAHIAPGARLGGAAIVEDGVLVGMGAVVLPQVRIGAGATIGAGAIVLADVAPGETVVGNPARRIGASF